MRAMRRAILAAALLALAACGQATAPNEGAATDSAQGEQAAPSPSPPSAADTMQYCSEVGRRVSEADCAIYGELAQSATRGMAAFNAPSPMQRGETRMLQLAISFAPPETPAPDAEPNESNLNPQTPVDVIDPLPGDTVQFQPLVGRFMRAELSGVGFDISPQTPARQEVTPESVTTWTWQVVARQGGERALTLTTVVEGCTESGECLPLRSTTQNYTVNVEVGRIDQVRDFMSSVPDWIKIVSAIVAALAGLIWAGVSLRSAVRKARDK